MVFWGSEADAQEEARASEEKWKEMKDLAGVAVRMPVERRTANRIDTFCFALFSFFTMSQQHDITNMNKLVHLLAIFFDKMKLEQLPKTIRISSSDEVGKWFRHVSPFL